jgi:hypothetical protein
VLFPFRDWFIYLFISLFTQFGAISHLIQLATGKLPMLSSSLIFSLCLNLQLGFLKLGDNLLPD